MNSVSNIATSRGGALDAPHGAGEEGALWLPWVPHDHVRSALFVEEGNGSRIRLSDNRWYLDASGGFAGLSLGHRRMEIAEAYRRQADLCAHYPLGKVANHPAAQLARQLRRLLASDLRWTFLSSSGSESIEAALKMAYSFHHCRDQPERSGIAVMQGAYHGATLGALSATQLEKCRVGFPQLPSVSVLKCPTKVGLNDALADMERTLTETRQIGAVVLELVKGVGGVRPLPADYVTRIAQVCHETETLLIIDEVLTGCGRTGRWFAHQRYDLAPDIITVSKGLTAGYAPLAATIATDAVYQTIGRDELFGGFRHGHTYSGHAAGCAAALAALDYVETHNLVAHAAQQGARLKAELADLQGSHGVLDVRGAGLLLGIEFESAELASRMHQRCADQFVLARNEGTTIALCPALNIDPAEIDMAIEAIYTAIQ